MISVTMYLILGTLSFNVFAIVFLSFPYHIPFREGVTDWIARKVINTPFLKLNQKDGQTLMGTIKTAYLTAHIVILIFFLDSVARMGRYRNERNMLRADLKKQGINVEKYKKEI
ncbi:hypothetical protein HDU92_007312 [Lobulomyces angularis]|nr:hypothetical protein HDU92_007312 [Lobulomyces angularis]